MNIKQLSRMVCLTGFIIVPILLNAQVQSNFKWTDAIPWAIALAGFIFGVYQYARLLKRKKQEKKAELEAKEEFRKKIQISPSRTAEEMYCAALKQELGTIGILGSPDFESKIVKLEDAFISLHISESWRVDDRFELHTNISGRGVNYHLTPEDVMKRAFQKYRVLLVIGDPGSGKTTLMKFYAMQCLDERERKFKQLGFSEKILPIYFPLRELEYENGRPILLPQNLVKWSKRHHLNIPEEHFHSWLQERNTLLLLDGLDEIMDKEQRQKVCRWVKDICAGLKNAHVVVTSRPTGYRKLDNIELEMPYLRADIMDFSPQQQIDFLRKWFRAVFLSQLPPLDMPEREWKELQEKRAYQQSQTIIEFLTREDNKAVQELARVPMLLQIMAMIWKDREYLPKTRPTLYDAALNYLLEYREHLKYLKPLLPAEAARHVLAPTALWMHEELKNTVVPKEAMHKFMQPLLNMMKDQPDAVLFCQNLQNRAGLIAAYGHNHYIFRHISFQEFLAGIQLVKNSHLTNRMETLTQYFKEDWWEETLRFFMSKADAEIFDRFIRLFFHSEISRQLDANKQTLLQLLVREAPQRKIDGLAECLNSDSLNDNQRRYVMDCLKTIGTPDAMETIEKADKSKWNKANVNHSMDILFEAKAMQKIPSEDVKEELEKMVGSDSSFRNPFEGNVEYIKIPGGTYKFSVALKLVTVPDLYFCKYPVTNKRYRRFISFLAGNEKKLEKKLPLDMFAENLLEFAKSIKGFTEYIGKNPKEWAIKHHPEYYEDKHFKGDDQPVIGVTWFAARSYCFWLSCLEAAIGRGEKLENLIQISSIYRLPTEVEWEWAAGGNPDGSIRQYPWPEDKGAPNPTLANYNRNVGTTTPVGRYPEGATPQGLMDMAGNVWEWMENYFDESKSSFALRGGSWDTGTQALRCVSRNFLDPDIFVYYFGFRVIRTLS